MPTTKSIVIDRELAALQLSQYEVDTDGCHLWTGSPNKETGYGSVTHCKQQIYIHRLAFEYVHGPVPIGKIVDHKCHNEDIECPGGACKHRACIHADHLAAVSHSENNTKRKVWTRKPSRLIRYEEVLDLIDALPILVRETKRRKGLSDRAAAEEIGISFMTLARIEDGGKDVSLKNFKLLLKWCAI